MTHQEELEQLFLANSCAITSGPESKLLTVRLMTFDSFESVINDKMNEAHYWGKLEGQKEH